MADEERRTALARLAESEAARAADHRHGARRVRRHRFDRHHRHLELAGRAHVRLDARRGGGAQPGRDAHPGRRSARRHLRGMEHFHSTGEAPVVNKRLELTALHRSGREFPVEITITWPMRIERGYFFGAFLRDISDRRERDAQLQAGQGVGRGGDAGQERVPRQHEPRAAHAAQRRARLRAAAAARPQPHAGAARGARGHFQGRRAPARPDQRRARPVEDRGRPRRHRGHGDRPRADGHRPQVPGGRGGAAQGAAAGHDHRARRAAARGARRPPPAPGAAQPAEQRHQVHRPRRRAAAHRQGRRRPPAVRGERHRHGHRARGDRRRSSTPSPRPSRARRPAAPAWA